MSIAVYYEKQDDGTMIIRQVEEKVEILHPGALDTAIENEKKPDRKNLLEQAKIVREDKEIKKIDSEALVKKHKEALAGKAMK